MSNDSYVTWKPYHPKDYPITSRHHNPWITIDPISGKSAYDIWIELGKPTDDTLQRKLDELSPFHE